MNLPWKRAWGTETHAAWIVFTFHKLLCRNNLLCMAQNPKTICSGHNNKEESTYWKNYKPWLWSVLWTWNTWDGQGWCKRPGWSGDSSYLYQRIRTGSTWGSKLRGTAGRTTPCKTGRHRNMKMTVPCRGLAELLHSRAPSNRCRIT